MTQDEPVPDEAFEVELAAYDDILANGSTPSWAMETTPRDERLRRAQACLQRLEMDRRAQQTSARVPSSASCADASSRLIGRYQVRRILGAGGFGIVYLAHDELLDRQVALKVPRPEALVTPELRHRFLREGRALARLNHPHIVPVYDSGQIGSLSYLVSAYCAGGSLAEWLRRRQQAVPPQAAAELVAGLADALQHAHDQGILHRDLKPANILLAVASDQSPVTRENGASGSLTTANWQLTTAPKITDFGLARFLEREEDRGGFATPSQALLGTPQYMSPEQAEGRHEAIGPPTDVYALGAILYELLTGRPPLTADRHVKTLHLVVHEEPVPPRGRRRDVPRDLEAICLKCLEKQPQRRYGTAAELAEDLRRFLTGQPTVARPLTPLGRLHKWVRRRPAIAIMLLVCGLASVALLFAAWINYQQRSDYQEVHARAEEERGRRTQLEQEQVQERDQQRNRKRQQDYAQHIAVVGRALREGNQELLRDLFFAQRPGTGHDDLRGFEWYYLEGQVESLRRLPDSPAGTTNVAFTPDGRQCVAVSQGRNLRVWDVSSERLVHGSPGANVVLERQCLSTDGRLFLSAASRDDSHPNEREMQLHETATGKLLGRYAFPECAHTVLALAPDGRTVAYEFPVDAKERRSQIRLRNLDTGAERILRPTAWMNATALLFAPDGKTLAVAYNSTGEAKPELAVELLNVDTGAVKAKVETEVHFIFTLAFSADGQMLAYGGWDRRVHIVDTRSGKQLHFLGIFAGNIGSLAFTRDNQVLAVGLDPEEEKAKLAAVSLWDLTTGTRLAPSLKPGCGVRALAFAPNGRTLGVGGSDGSLRWWNCRAAPEHHDLSGHSPFEAWAVAFAPHADVLASAGDDCLIRLWDTASGKEKRLFLGHTSLVPCVAFAPDGKFLASASHDRTVKIWDTATGKILGNCLGHSHHVRSLAVSPLGRLVASSGRDPVIRIWDAATGKQQTTLEGDTAAIWALVFSPDGSLLASADGDGTVRLWDTTTWTQTRTLVDTSSIHCLAFAPDGRTLASGNKDGLVKLWSLSGEQDPVVLRGHGSGGLRAGVRALAFSPKGRTLVSGGGDRTIRFWHPDVGVEMLVLADQPHGIYGLAFSSDNQTLAAALENGTIRLWKATRD